MSSASQYPKILRQFPIVMLLKKQSVLDGLAKRINDKRYMQRYTPRKTRSHWSGNNIARAKKMIKKKLMTKKGLSIFQEGIKNKEKAPSSKK